MASHSMKDRPVRTASALWRVVDGCAVIFHEETGRAFVLNDTATRMWEMCDGGVTLGQIAESHCGGEAAGAERELAQDTIDQLFDQLVEEGFIAMEDSARDAPPSSVGPPSPAGEWHPPVAEEIRFAACDCTGDAYGNLRNLECLLVSPGLSS